MVRKRQALIPSGAEADIVRLEPRRQLNAQSEPFRLISRLTILFFQKIEADCRKQDMDREGSRERHEIARFGK